MKIRFACHLDSKSTSFTKSFIARSTALPMIFLFWFFALTRATLPHWNAPAYVLLILLDAVYLNEKETNGGKTFPKWITVSLAVTVLVVVIGSIEIKTGFVPLDKHTEETELGKDDFTLDMYGWRQLAPKFAALRDAKIAEGAMKESDGIIASQWFPAANIDYYVARPLNMKVFGFGHPENIHKYLWINEKRGGINKGENGQIVRSSLCFQAKFQLP